MATVTATYAPAAGRQAVTLTSWAGSATFATTPTAGSQIEGADALTIGVDGVITGANGTYAIHHITTAGVIEADSFAIATADTTAPIISALTAAGTDPDTIDVAFSTDEDNGTAYFFASGSATETAAAIKAGAQGSQAVSAAGNQSLALTLATGTYRIHALHEDTAGNQSNVLSSAEIVLAAIPEVGTGTATYAPPADMTLTTVQEPVDEYLTDGWSSPPETGEQVLTFTAEGAFDPQLNWSGPAEGEFDYYYINNAGAMFQRTITTGSLDSLADTTPSAFSFTDVTGQPVSTVTESNIITITGVDAATDVAASITGGEYAVSTDDGATFGAYTSAATNVQLDYQVKVRVTTSANNSTGTSAVFTSGGVSDTFTATTEAEFTQAPQGTWTIGTITVGETTASLTPSYSLTDAASYQYSINSGAWITFTGTISLTSLTADTPYSGAVRAVNSVGSGDNELFSFTTDAIPAEPTVPQGAITALFPVTTQTTAEITFSYIESDATGFEYSTNGATWIATTSPLTLTGLSPSTTDSVQLRAINDAGPGEALTVNYRTKGEPVVVPEGDWPFFTPTTIAAKTWQWSGRHPKTGMRVRIFVETP